MKCASKKNQASSLAIVGMSCRFPGKAHTLNAFHKILKNKIDAICLVPKNRWNCKKFYNQKKVDKTIHSSNEGGFLQANIFDFDPDFFNLFPHQVEEMDPQQRLLLELTWEAIEDGGLILSDLQEVDTGVFVAGFNQDNVILKGSPHYYFHGTSETSLSFSTNLLDEKLVDSTNLLTVCKVLFLIQEGGYVRSSFVDIN